jgi:hypothetical protein
MPCQIQQPVALNELPNSATLVLNALQNSETLVSDELPKTTVIIKFAEFCHPNGAGFVGRFWGTRSASILDFPIGYRGEQINTSMIQCTYAIHFAQKLNV